VPKKSKSGLNIALAGARGKMGTAIQELASKERGLKITARVNEAGDWKSVDPKEVDLVIEFSSPAGLAKALAWCVKNKKPLVSGTTGLSAREKSALTRAAKKLPILYSANMSLGIAVMTSMLGALGAVKEWKFQIEEAHHALKRDKPSGTAILLQKKLKSVIGRALPDPVSYREGSLPGTHEVWAEGPDEILVLQHTALDRRVFARGALRAARWLFDKNRPGLYDLSHLYIVPK
jgi:4-hydroxy-tetrahydrodipicolinate reductase